MARLGDIDPDARLGGACGAAAPVGARPNFLSSVSKRAEYGGSQTPKMSDRLQEASFFDFLFKSGPTLSGTFPATARIVRFGAKWDGGPHLAEENIALRP